MVSRSLSFRLIALVVALLGSLAAPASALTHGWLHEHAAHEQAEHHAQEASHASSVAHAAVDHTAMAVTAEVEEQDNHHRHGHNTIAVAPAARDGLRLILLAVTALTTTRAELPGADFAAVPAAAFLNRSFLARPDPGGTSPPNLRAPPVS